MWQIFIDNYYTMKYYYNNVPGQGLCRNNLIYTSLVSEDQKLFCQWYHNDTEYHAGKNQMVDPKLMKEKFHRELHYLSNMAWHYPDMVPKIKEVNIPEYKIYLEIDGPDFWERAGCDVANYNAVLPDWQDQMLAIIQAHKDRGWHKYSMHPSSYFVVDGKLKSINYFFTYHKDEPNISIANVESHIYTTRQDEMRKHLDTLGINWNQSQPWAVMDQLCWASFSTNYPAEFIERVKCIL
jgi:L-rhamnose mutarotase